MQYLFAMFGCHRHPVISRESTLSKSLTTLVFNNICSWAWKKYKTEKNEKKETNMLQQIKQKAIDRKKMRMRKSSKANKLS